MINLLVTINQKFGVKYLVWPGKYVVDTFLTLICCVSFLLHHPVLQLPEASDFRRVNFFRRESCIAPRSKGVTPS